MSLGDLTYTSVLIFLLNLTSINSYIMANEHKIFNHLLDIGCCKCCSLRFLRDRNIDFNNVDEYIKKKKLLSNSNETSQSESDQQIKKCKLNPCIVCLGLLQDFVMEEVVNGVLLSEVQKYDTKVFTCSISIPAATLIREHSIRVDLHTSFPEYYENEIEEYPLNKAWKWIIKDRLTEKLNMKFENSDVCNFSVNIIMDYDDNNQELLVVKKFTTKTVKNGELYSRKSVCNILSSCSKDKFMEIVKIPPEIPSKALVCKQIECKHNSVYLAGRYCKYSRELSQSPWIIDGVKTMESSVEEIIFEQISKLFSIPTASIKFSASGREDCDVRCLGKGRPFYIEILDPRKTTFSFQEFRELETKINESTLISVRDLQSVQRAELVKVKEGEQMKTKDYIALCRTKNSITQEHIDTINNFGEVALEQKTPIRVLHRRPLAVRSKKVYKMEAKLIPDKSNVFELQVVTEAGTYVKEFVHGDFGRTKPSIGTIIGTEVDIIALDVVAINLDWPKKIDIGSTEKC